MPVWMIVAAVYVVGMLVDVLDTYSTPELRDTSALQAFVFALGWPLSVLVGLYKKLS